MEDSRDETKLGSQIETMQRGTLELEEMSEGGARVELFSGCGLWSLHPLSKGGSLACSDHLDTGDCTHGLRILLCVLGFGFPSFLKAGIVAMPF